MPADASLAKLIKDFGGTWVIEHTGAGTAWATVRRDGDDIRILGAHDIGGLRYQMELAEREARKSRTRVSRGTYQLVGSEAGKEEASSEHGLRRGGDVKASAPLRVVVTVNL